MSEYEIIIERMDDADGGRWRAELWWRPYRGWMVAATRWLKTKAGATRDARFLKIPTRRPR